MTRRIIAIQHGDYREASEIIERGGVEPYFGMSYSHAVLEKLFGDDPHIVVSLDAPAYRERRGSGELIGMPAPQLPRRVPRRVAEFLLAMRITSLIRSFRPTHVLLRTALPIVSEKVLRLCRKKNYDTLVVFANVMTNDAPRFSERNRRLIDLLNQPFVFRVGNHKRPATQSLIDCGLDPAKAIAYDWPGHRKAEDSPTKALPSAPFKLVYVGSIIQSKGVGDLIDAALILHQGGVAFHLSIIGSGPDQAAMQEKARSLPEGTVRFEGRISNDDVFEFMKRAAIVFVPSRHEFPEGLPFTLTEALASRTPVVASDHPVIVRGFQDGEGLRLFRASDPSSIAEVTRAILRDPIDYQRLSLTTAAALNRVYCPLTFGDLLDRWEQAS